MTEKRAASVKAWQAAHPEKMKAIQKNWKKLNRDKVNEGRRKWRIAHIENALFIEAKSRSKARGVPFTICLQDIPPVGTHCPLLGHPFAEVGSGSPFSPSLDRIDPRLGYVVGNVWIVGRRANLIKNDGTAEDHEQIARAMRAVEAASL